jgi:hypothetical protein
MDIRLAPLLELQVGKLLVYVYSEARLCKLHTPGGRTNTSYIRTKSFNVRAMKSYYRFAHRNLRTGR